MQPIQSRKRLLRIQSHSLTKSMYPSQPSDGCQVPSSSRQYFLITSLNSLVLLCLLIVGLSDARDVSCPLTCENGGQCRLQGAIGIATSDGASSTAATTTSFYCHCPRGFWGPSCEIQFLMCQSSNSTCFNGEPCYRDVDHDGEPFYRCQCDISSTSLTDMTSPYTYRLCARAANTFCNRQTEDDNNVSNSTKAKKSSGQDATFPTGSYCANAGKCKSPDRNDTLHPGCDCPAGWTDNFCETPIGYESQAQAAAKESIGAKTESPSGSQRSWASVLWGVVSGLVILVVGLAIMYWWYIGLDDLVDAVCAKFRPHRDPNGQQDSPRRNRSGGRRSRRSRRRRQKRRDLQPEVELAPTKAGKPDHDDAMGETDEDSDDDIGEDEEGDSNVHVRGTDAA